MSGGYNVLVNFPAPLAPAVIQVLGTPVIGFVIDGQWVVNKVSVREDDVDGQTIQFEAWVEPKRIEH